MKKGGIIFIIAVILIGINSVSTQAAGKIIKAGSLHVTGASFLKGPIVNLQGGPVVIGDDLRVDGAITRAFGPVKISDGIFQTSNENVLLNGKVYANNGLTVAGALSLPDGSITADMLADGAGGGSLTDNSVASAHIVDGAIVNADINSQAAIQASKLSGVVVTAPTASQTVSYSGAGVQTILQMAASPTANPFVINNSEGTGVFAINTSGLISTASVNSASIVDGSITAADIADGVLSVGVADNSITTAKILDGTVATGDIADSAITTGKIENGTIANADISSSAGIVISKLESTSGQGKVILSNPDGNPIYSAIQGDATLAGNGTLSINNITRTIQLPLAGWFQNTLPPVVTLTGSSIPAITAADTNRMISIKWATGETTFKTSTTFTVPEDYDSDLKMVITYLYETSNGTTDNFQITNYKVGEGAYQGPDLYEGTTTALTQDVSYYRKTEIPFQNTLIPLPGDTIRVIAGFTAINDTIHIVGIAIKYSATR